MTDERFADLVLTNGRIYTVDPGLPWAQALCIKNGQVHYVGSDAGAAAFIGGRSEVIDLAGRMVMPGINDFHIHALDGTRLRLFESACPPGTAFAYVVALVSKIRAQLSAPNWIRINFEDASLFRVLAHEGALGQLDQASPDCPVVLNIMLHGRFLNTVALRRAGITDATQNLRGHIVRDPHSARLTGLLVESACALVDQVMPRYGEQHHHAAASDAVRMCNAVGMTGFLEAAMSEAALRAYKRLDDEGGLTAWVGACIATETMIAPAHDGVGDEVIARRARYRSRRLRPDFVKFFMDGVPSMRTSAFLEPYADDPDFPGTLHGDCHHAVDALAERLAALDADGLSIKIHAIGDRAIRSAIDAIEIVRRRNGRDGPRHHIAHLNFITEADIPRLRQLNVVADFCPPLWCPSGATGVMEAMLGKARVARSWPIRSVIEAGALATAGSDWPCISPTPVPWPGLQALITRKNPFGRADGTLGPDQAIDLATAIRLYTINPAQAMGLEAVTGSLMPGKSADMIVLSQNLFDVNVDEIGQTRVVTTYFAGQRVFGDA
jgi:predicted amidohydrolase YtcJ